MSIVNCPECHKEISDKSKVCIHCGKRVSRNEKHVCDECGTVFEASNKVCPECGCPIPFSKRKHKSLNRKKE